MLKDTINYSFSALLAAHCRLQSISPAELCTKARIPQRVLITGQAQSVTYRLRPIDVIRLVSNLPRKLNEADADSLLYSAGISGKYINHALAAACNIPLPAEAADNTQRLVVLILHNLLTVNFNNWESAREAHGDLSRKLGLPELGTLFDFFGSCISNIVRDYNAQDLADVAINSITTYSEHNPFKETQAALEPLIQNLRIAKDQGLMIDDLRLDFYNLQSMALGDKERTDSFEIEQLAPVSEIEAALNKIIEDKKLSPGPLPERVLRISKAIKESDLASVNFISLSDIAKEFQGLAEPRRAAASAVSWLNEQLTKSGGSLFLDGEVYYRVVDKSVKKQ